MIDKSNEILALKQLIENEIIHGDDNYGMPTDTTITKIADKIINEVFYRLELETATDILKSLSMNLENLKSMSDRLDKDNIMVGYRSCIADVLRFINSKKLEYGVKL